VHAHRGPSSKIRKKGPGKKNIRERRKTLQAKLFWGQGGGHGNRTGREPNRDSPLYAIAEACEGQKNVFLVGRGRKGLWEEGGTGCRKVRKTRSCRGTSCSVSTWQVAALQRKFQDGVGQKELMRRKTSKKKDKGGGIDYLFKALWLEHSPSRSSHSSITKKATYQREKRLR